MILTILAVCLAAVLVQAEERQEKPALEVQGEVRRLATGMEFVEGPVWLPKEEKLVFSDLPASRLMEWSEGGGLKVYREVEEANGNLLDLEGRLLTCQHGARNIIRTEKDGSITVLADRFNGTRFNSPNDLAVKSDGTLWFTDPPWGLPNQTEGREYEGHWVFRLDPESGDVTVLIKDLAMPNGIAFSPDEKQLYVADTGGLGTPPDVPYHEMPATISAYDVLDGNRLSAKPAWRIEAVCDGMTVDVKGRIYATGFKGVSVWDADGKPVGLIETPEQPANVCFGGKEFKTLFITAQTSLYAVEMGVKGSVVKGAK